MTLKKTRTASKKEPAKKKASIRIPKSKGNNSRICITKRWNESGDPEASQIFYERDL